MLLKLTNANSRSCLVNSSKIEFIQTYYSHHLDQEINRVVLRHAVPFKGNTEIESIFVEVKETMDDILYQIGDNDQFIRLKNYKGKSDFLVNTQQIESVYQVWDKSNEKYCTKITFNGGRSYINVEEDIDTIHDKVYGLISYEDNFNSSYNI